MRDGETYSQGIMVIVARIGLGDPSSNPRGSCMHFT